MPPEPPIPGTPADWLARARSDLALAQVPLPEGAVYEDLCFHAQQAAEKSIKAVYRSRNLRFRYTHNLGQLLEGLKNQGLPIPPEVSEAIELTAFAWEVRYPTLGEAVTEAEYRRAVNLAARVLRWAEALVQGKTV